MFRTLPMSPIAPGSLRSFVRGLAPAAWYQFGTGITVVGAGVDTWADQSGNARDLLQATDTNRPTLNADGSITFDGVDNFLKASAFTLNQPETVYFLGAQITWTSGDSVFDGNVNDCLLLYQRTTTPNLAMYAGANVDSNPDLALNTDGVIACVYNGAASVIQTNNNAPVTGDASTGSGGGFTLGASGGGISGFGNIRAKEVIIFAAAHDAATRARVIAYLRQVGGL